MVNGLEARLLIDLSEDVRTQVHVLALFLESSLVGCALLGISQDSAYLILCRGEGLAAADLLVAVAAIGGVLHAHTDRCVVGLAVLEVNLVRLGELLLDAVKRRRIFDNSHRVRQLDRIWPLRSATLAGRPMPPLSPQTIAIASSLRGPYMPVVGVKRLIKTVHSIPGFPEIECKGTTKMA